MEKLFGKKNNYIMKKILLILMVLFTLNSCSTITAGVSYSSEYSTQYYAGERIEYYHEYYYNGSYYPVIYINSIPWFYYLDCWYCIPTNRYVYIRNHHHPHYHYVYSRPPYKRAPQYKHQNNGHNVRPSQRPNQKPNNHNTVRPNQIPNNGHMNGNRPSQRPGGQRNTNRR